MENQPRYNRDKFIVISIIKYTLYVLIAFVILLFAQKMILILLPFLIGFVLAKASRHIAGGLIRFWDLITKRKQRLHARPYCPPSKKDEPDKISLWRKIFPKSSKKLSRNSRVSVVIYIILLISMLALIILGTMAVFIQLSNAAKRITEWIAEAQANPGLMENEAANIFRGVGDWIEQFSTDNGGFISPDQIIAFTNYLETIPRTITSNLPSAATMIESIVDTVSSALGSLPILLFSIIVIIMSGFYFLTDNKFLFEFFSRNVKSRSFRHKIIQLINRLSTLLFRVLGGYLLLLLVTFFEALIVLLIAGVNYALILALVTAVLDFMPVLGVGATFVPLMVYSFMQGNYTGILILLIGWIIITIIRRLLEPNVLGNAMQMHPMATLFSMIVGVAAWGAIGFIVGPIVFLIATEAAKTFSLDTKLRDFFGNLLNKI